MRLNATSPTFLCVEGDGKELFNGTLSGARTFRGRVVRVARLLDVGLVLQHEGQRLAGHQERLHRGGERACRR